MLKKQNKSITTKEPQAGEIVSRLYYVSGNKDHLLHVSCGYLLTVRDMKVYLLAGTCSIHYTARIAAQYILTLGNPQPQISFPPYILQGPKYIVSTSK